MKKKNLLLTAFAMLTFALANAQSTNPAPYCVATFDDGMMPVGDHINKVVLGTLNNTTNAQYPAPHYVFYNNLTVPNLTKGSNYTLTLDLEVDGGAGYGVWIDYNHNNTFEATEKVAGSASATDWLTIGNNTIKTSSITIPTTAMTGNTRMRVRIVEDDIYTAAHGPLIAPCNASTSATDVMDWGETEDYTINIVGTTSVSDVEQAKINIYPNPASNTLTIDNSSSLKLNSYEIYSVIGQRVMESTFTNSINISNLNTGMYYLVLRNEQNEKIIKSFTKNK